MGYQSDKQSQAYYMDVVRKSRERERQNQERTKKKRTKIIQTILVLTFAIFAVYFALHVH
jgi:hypothetical protein